jgi:hypothetical protein
MVALLGAVVVPTAFALILGLLLPGFVAVVPLAMGSLAQFVSLTFIVAVAHVLILFWPTIVSLQRLGWIRWWSSGLAGFVLGCLPIGAWLWPLHYSGTHVSSVVWRSGKMVQTAVNGVPTLAGWLQYAGIVFQFGLCGAVGGLAFWFVWRNAVEGELRARRALSGDRH